MTDLDLTAAAHAKFEALLPTDYQGMVVKIGQIVIDAGSGSVYEGEQRCRGGNWFRNMLATISGQKPERFKRSWRRAQLGEVTPGSWSGNESKPCLAVIDTLYQPIEPVDGNTEPARHTQAIYRLGAFDDSVSGSRFTFNFLQQGNNLLDGSVTYCTAQAPEDISETEDKEMRRFLETYGLDPEYPLQHHMSDLADLCIRLASAADSRTIS